MKAELLVMCPICDEKKSRITVNNVLITNLAEMPSMDGMLAYKCECGINEMIEGDDLVYILQQVTGTRNDTELLKWVVNRQWIKQKLN